MKKGYGDTGSKVPVKTLAQDIIDLTPMLFKRGNSIGQLSQRFGIPAGIIESIIRQEMRKSGHL